MRVAVTALAAALLLAPAATSATRSGRAPSAARQKTLESQILQDVNAVRRGHGLKPLTFSSKLASAAAEHTREMGVDGYFEHASFDSTPFWKRIARWYPSTTSSMWSVGENLVYAAPDISAEQSLRMWMNSPPHRANLLSRTWREIGIGAIHFDAAPGTYRNDAVTIVTADFGLRR
jgi:uncharacterized protein YkwD